MATPKQTHATGGEPPPGLKPDWWATLKARSFAEGIQEADRYLKNAEANARKAGVHPVDPDRFLDVKYSSTAAQQGYVAAMILVDGFVASCPLEAIHFVPDSLTFRPTGKYPTRQDAEKAKRQSFWEHGLNGMHAYVNFIELAFSDKLSNFFRVVYNQLHLKAHYHQDEYIKEFQIGFQALQDFRAEFVQEARKQLQAAGVAV